MVLFLANGHDVIIRLLLSRDKLRHIVYTRDVRGCTAAHDAAENKHPVCLKLLAEAGLNIHQKNEVSSIFS